MNCCLGVLRAVILGISWHVPNLFGLDSWLAGSLCVAHHWDIEVLERIPMREFLHACLAIIAEEAAVSEGFQVCDSWFTRQVEQSACQSVCHLSEPGGLL